LLKVHQPQEHLPYGIKINLKDIEMHILDTILKREAHVAIQELPAAMILMPEHVIIEKQ